MLVEPGTLERRVSVCVWGEIMHNVCYTLPRHTGRLIIVVGGSMANSPDAVRPTNGFGLYYFG